MQWLDHFKFLCKIHGLQIVCFTIHGLQIICFTQPFKQYHTTLSLVFRKSNLNLSEELKSRAENNNFRDRSLFMWGVGGGGDFFVLALKTKT